MVTSLSSPGVAFSSPALSSSSNRFLFRNQNASPSLLSLPAHRPSRSVLVCARGKNRKGFTSSSSSSPKKNKKKGFGGGEEQEEDDPFEALFNLLEEDLNNDKSSLDDEEISEEDLDRLAAELAEVLGGGDDVDGIDLFGSETSDVVDDEEDDGNDDGDIEEDDDDEEEDERPAKLKNWQLRRLAYALKAGKRKTSIKNLAAELCLDRAYVLELLRDPPPKLLMLSATLPDEKPPVPAPENSSPPDPNPLEPSSAEEDAVEVEPEGKVKEEAVHVMQQRWSAQKRVKKAHIETLEKVYRRSKRPTNAVVSSIVQVTNLPRRRVLKWFEDRRAEDGVPEKRAPYQAPV
ncbi:unnamed protein product [Eruca vesicaria subsp. sativa]|uniref:Homeobox domain-containing protein n=1 Tax=Eruca vesicaria subsp. sativa TaxID=29727 RepID=A0ABC8ILN1_ERUVS|nr:unnamed protein product [Eruca vesicaria subsp. sativa]